jgi:hypothetical protein
MVAGAVMERVGLETAVKGGCGDDGVLISFLQHV